MSRVAVLGLGSMGSRMAINYLSAGHDVVVWNRTRQCAEALAESHGFAIAETPRSAAGGADVVVSIVANDEAAQAVWLDPGSGAFSGMGGSSIAIESSTLTPGTVRKIGEVASSAGLPFIEAPVVGSRPQAEAGQLFVLLGGDQSVIDKAAAIIEVNAGGISRIGDVGDAAVMKLAINGLFAAQVAAYAEVVGFFEQSPIDTSSAIETLSNLPITSPGLQRILGLVAERKFEPNFPVPLVAKDLRYLSATGAEMGAALPLMDAARAVFEAGAAGAAGKLDIAGIASIYLE